MVEMTQNDIYKLHRALLIIADEIDRICRKHNIHYSLIGGSMLGSIRHKGFIPWDDDMDIGLLRGDYQAFLHACDVDLDERFTLQTNTSDPYYVYGFSKILLKDTRLVQFGHENTKYEKGIFVDIFPFDYIPNNENDRSKQRRTNYLLIKLLRQKMKVSDNVNWGIREKVFFKALSFAGLFITKKELVKLLNDNMVRYNSTESLYVSNMSGYYGYDRETVPAILFTSFVDVRFEDRIYSICSDYDSFLKLYYNDYMKLPPVDQRRTHGFKELDFGPYNSTL
ncbi:MAG: LicD family protein [Lachnospiraceae bacterium]|nr:LicD family protein [Lachnospiraceae bacterium]